ncbi:hypothetical protein AMECASPLE_016003 [Ameca splendens]|uniref:Uncharacterized protein n=1 Tax=Ameca splendens TaxID=208324 RepID=A0ABV1A8G9_9TELE
MGFWSYYFTRFYRNDEEGLSCPAHASMIGLTEPPPAATVTTFGATRCSEGSVGRDCNKAPGAHSVKNISLTKGQMVLNTS